VKALRTVATGGVEKRTFGHRAPHRPTVGTPFHGKQVDPDKLVWAIAALAEGVRSNYSNLFLQWRLCTRQSALNLVIHSP